MHRQPALWTALALLLGSVVVLGCQSEKVKPIAEDQVAEEPAALDTFFDPAVIQTIVLDIAPADRQRCSMHSQSASTFRRPLRGEIFDSRTSVFVSKGIAHRSPRHGGSGGC